MYIFWIITINSFKKNQLKSVKKKRDNYSLLLIRITTIISIIIALLLSVAKIDLLSSWFFVLGVAFMVLGFLIREWAIITIKQFFSFQVSIYSNHKLVNKGLYRFIRHPAYTGALITIIGLGIALRSVIGLGFIIILTGLACGYRIKLEEKFLINEFGEEYITYKKKTKLLIPWVW